MAIIIASKCEHGVKQNKNLQKRSNYLYYKFPYLKDLR